MPDHRGDLWIANTVRDLIQGDVHEHLPLEAIPLGGDVLGLGTTTSIDNGELTFLPNSAGNTTIWKCQASDGGIRALHTGDGSAHFPYVCFSGDASDLRVLVEPAELGPVEEQPLQELVAEAIQRLRAEGRLAEAPIYGLRAELEWRSLVITVASKLCMGQQRRNTAIASSAASEGTASRSIYQLLQHYRLAEQDPGDPEDPIRYLGRSLHWECCGFFDTDPATGRVTIPAEGAHLHLHGCSTDLRHGGHLHHEHPGTILRAVKRLALYPLHQLHQLASDLAIEQLRFEAGVACFSVVNRGALDVSDVGVAVVVNDRYAGHRYLRLPWLAAGASEQFSVPLALPAGRHRLEVIADPERQILEAEELQANNRAALELQI
ncbi:MAG: CARDB domain-containing protein [Cyanobacteriota bacterium]|nr:CARDB domain-containing protein [Cyanobacteriota bacterium]